MPIFYQPVVQEGINHLDQEEARHAIKVLRLQSGDPLRITDGKGSIYECTITDITKSTCSFSVHKTISVPRRNFSIHIAIAPTKNIDRIEWFVEKATEMGIEKISFVRSKNSERTVVNPERLAKKAISAMKQSGQAWLPLLQPIQPFDQLLDFGGLKYIAHVDPENPQHLKEAPPNGHYLVLVGPEGDFSQQEVDLAVEKGFQKVSLGATTLRTETAGLAACFILNLINS